MLRGKQRSYLKSLANGLDPVIFIGKDGLTPGIEQGISQALDAHELVKCKIQQGNPLEPQEVCSQLAEKLNAEFVQAIGRTFTLYRRAPKAEDRKIVLPR